jgi:hypothetical protein
VGGALRDSAGPLAGRCWRGWRWQNHRLGILRLCALRASWLVVGAGPAGAWQRAACQLAFLFGKPHLGVSQFLQPLRVSAYALLDCSIYAVQLFAHASESPCNVVVGRFFLADLRRLRKGFSR